MADVMLKIAYTDWHAVHDHLGKTLRVYGECLLPGGGSAVRLAPHVGSMDPQVFMLELRLSPAGESPAHQSLEFSTTLENRADYIDVDFVATGPVGVNTPAPLQIRDVY